MGIPVLQPVAGGNVPLASDVNQLVRLLLGKQDAGGALSLFRPIPAPQAPALAAGPAGNPSGEYRCVVVHVTGWLTDAGTYVVAGMVGSGEALISVSGFQIQWTLPTPPAGVIARVLYRTRAGGATGTEEFAVWVGDSVTTVVLDNVADGALGTGMPGPSSTPPVIGNAVPAPVPVGNTTGTILSGGGSNVLTSPQFRMMGG
jgi:hypothetical protein